MSASTKLDDLPDENYDDYELTDRISNDISKMGDCDEEEQEVPDEDLPKMVENFEKSLGFKSFLINSWKETLYTFVIVVSTILSRPLVIKTIMRVSPFSKLEPSSIVFTVVLGILASIVFLILKFLF